MGLLEVFDDGEALVERLAVDDEDGHSLIGTQRRKLRRLLFALAKVDRWETQRT